MTTYESTKEKSATYESIKERIECQIKGIQDDINGRFELHVQKSNLEKVLMEFETTHDSLGKNLANEIEGIYDKQDIYAIISTSALGLGGYIIGFGINYMIVHSINNNINAGFIGGVAGMILGAIEGIILEKKITKHKFNKLLKNNPGHAAQIQEYSNKLHQLNDSQKLEELRQALGARIGKI
jgi:hypothetical protein